MICICFKLNLGNSLLNLPNVQILKATCEQNSSLWPQSNHSKVARLNKGANFASRLARLHIYFPPLKIKRFVLFISEPFKKLHFSGTVFRDICRQ